MRIEGRGCERGDKSEDVGVLLLLVLPPLPRDPDATRRIVSALQGRCPPRQTSRVERLRAKVEPLLTSVTVDTSQFERVPFSLLSEIHPHRSGTYVVLGRFRGASLIRNGLPPYGHHMALDIVLLQGPRRGLSFSEVPL